MRIMPRYIRAPHLDLLDQRLVDLLAAPDGRLIVAMPPRHGKSLTVSRILPSWYLGTHPDQRVILVSYASSLANKHSRAARGIVRSDAYAELFPEVRLAHDSRAVDAWDIAGHAGGLDALGIGGSVTGKGADLLIVDDPVKNRAEAESASQRDRVYDSFTDDLYTRLEPGGAAVVMMTRWHQDDLTGRLLRLGGWDQLVLPALALPGDPLGRAEGAALWPERFPLARLDDIRATLGEYGFAALYQQHPVPAEGGIFKRAWCYPLADAVPPLVEEVRFWDLAMSARETADYTVGVRLGTSADGDVYVVDVARRRLDWAAVVAFMIDVILADGPAVRQGVEKKGYMSRAVADLNRDPRLRGYTIQGYNVDTDKITRALPFAAKMSAEIVHLLDRGWTRSYIAELTAFPHADRKSVV